MLGDVAGYPFEVVVGVELSMYGRGALTVPVPPPLPMALGLPMVVLLPWVRVIPVPTPCAVPPLGLMVP